MLGPNGGGKTTLFQAAAGRAAAAAPARSTVAGAFGYVPQTERSRLDYPVSALDVALMGALSRRRRGGVRPGRAERRAAREALDTRRARATAPRRRSASSRAGSASACWSRAPSSGRAGAAARRAVHGRRRSRAPSCSSGFSTGSPREGRGVLIATHDLEQARRWDLVLCLNRRQIAFGPAGARRSPREVLEADLWRRDRGAPRQAASRSGSCPPHHHDRDGLNTVNFAARAMDAAASCSGRLLELVLLGRPRGRARLLGRLLRALVRRRSLAHALFPGLVAGCARWACRSLLGAAVGRPRGRASAIALVGRRPRSDATPRSPSS